jgi:hypothetical protein
VAGLVVEVEVGLELAQERALVEPPIGYDRRVGSGSYYRGSRTVRYIEAMKSTAYFAAIRSRPDRSVIRDEWIERAIRSPIREHVQADGRVRRWTQVPEMENRYLRVVLLADRETVHNAFFDRRYQP